MTRSFLVLCGIVIAFFLFTLFVSADPRPPVGDGGRDRETTYGPQWEKTCDHETCEVAIYSYEKFWKGDQGWEEVDPTWFSCGDNFCTKEYGMKIVATPEGLVTATRRDDGRDWGVHLTDFRGQHRVFRPSIDGNVITYTDVVPGVDLRYHYDSRGLKEELVIAERFRTPIQENFNITFAKYGNADFIVPPSIICDATYYCEEIRHWITADNIIVEVPAAFLNDEEIEYPVSIDPSIELDSADIAWNGHVRNFTNTSGVSIYTRTQNPTLIRIAADGGIQPGEDEGQRGDIDWNVSAIPLGSDITSAKVRLSFRQPGVLNPGNFNVSIYPMDKHNMSYSDTTSHCEGNCEFYTDMKNGSVYNETFIGTFSVFTTVNMTLSHDALTDIEESIATDLFSMGLVSPNPYVTVDGKDSFSFDLRPILYITYGANQSNASSGIVQGIIDSVLDNNIPINSDQQIYLVNEEGNHFLGTFDKTTTQNNQTWAFNYVLGGEFFTFMPSLFNILNTWENTSLSYNEIVEQVEIFINETVV